MMGDCWSDTFNEDIHISIDEIKDIDKHDTYYLSQNEFITHMFLVNTDIDRWEWDDLSEKIPIEILLLYPEYPWDLDYYGENKNQYPDVVKPVVSMLPKIFLERYDPEYKEYEPGAPQSYWERKYKSK